jgi:hypothetical protein
MLTPQGEVSAKLTEGLTPAASHPIGTVQAPAGLLRGGDDAMPKDPEKPPPGPEADSDEILDTGQEEVFSRAEVELGAIEHASEAGKKGRTD